MNEDYASWSALVGPSLPADWLEMLPPAWLEDVYRDHGPISADDVESLADVEIAARLEASAASRLELAKTLLPMVLADVEAVGLPRPTVDIELDAWHDLTIWVTFTPKGGSTTGGNCGGTSSSSTAPGQLLAWLAEAIQETTMEGDQIHCRVWPVCNIHQLGGHVVVDETDIACWWCGAGGGHVIARIGQLATAAA